MELLNLSDNYAINVDQQYADKYGTERLAGWLNENEFAIVSKIVLYF